MDYYRGSKTCLANVLSRNDICTVINKKGGPVLWGNRLAEGTLIPHQRLRYIIGDSITLAHEDYVDRNLSGGMAMIKVLQGMNCFIDGEEFIGTATKAGIVFPQPKVKEVASPGYAGLRKLQTGKMEIEDIKITLQDYPAKVIAMVGHPDSVDKDLQLIGAIGPKDPRTITITVSGA